MYVEEDTREHLILGCQWVQQVWIDTMGHRLDWGMPASIEYLLLRQCGIGDSDKRRHEKKWELCLIACWFIWKARCRKSFENKMSVDGLVAREIIEAHDELERV